ncbi:hypothetical protein D9M68_998700 [compost metagenome]
MRGMRLAPLVGAGRVWAATLRGRGGCDLRIDARVTLSAVTSRPVPGMGVNIGSGCRRAWGLAPVDNLGSVI